MPNRISNVALGLVRCCREEDENLLKTNWPLCSTKCLGKTCFHNWKFPHHKNSFPSKSLWNHFHHKARQTHKSHHMIRFPTTSYTSKREKLMMLAASVRQYFIPTVNPCFIFSFFFPFSNHSTEKMRGKGMWKHFLFGTTQKKCSFDSTMKDVITVNFFDLNKTWHAFINKIPLSYTYRQTHAENGSGGSRKERIIICEDKKMYITCIHA